MHKSCTFIREITYSNTSCAVGLNSAVLSQIMSNSKHLCETCGFMVVVEGHASRCRISGSPEIHIRLRRMAWLGDIRHGADVRILLLCSGVPDDKLQLRAAEYVSNKHMADYYNKYDGPKERALGTSAHSLATAFEASYVGTFRRDYLIHIASDFKLESVDESIADHVDQLVGSNSKV